MQPLSITGSELGLQRWKANDWQLRYIRDRHPLNVNENKIISLNYITFALTLFGSIDMLMFCRMKQISTYPNSFILFFKRHTLCFNDWIKGKNCI